MRGRLSDTDEDLMHMCCAGFAAPGSGLAGNSAGSMTLGMEEQKQGGGNMARRKFKAKRPNK